MARLLAVIPWIAAQQGPTLDEVCARFGVTRRKLEEDLTVLTLVGVPPYTPDTLIEVTIEGDRVWLRFADVFAKPLHLTPEQAVALVAAGTASQGLPGGDSQGPLATALAKLAGVLGLEPGETLSVALGDTRPGVLEALRRAVAEHRRVRLDYYAYGRDDRSTRDVDPAAVFAHEGFWYVRVVPPGRPTTGCSGSTASSRRWCWTRPSTRGATAAGTRTCSTTARGSPRVTLDVAVSARWVAETYPVDEVGRHARGPVADPPAGDGHAVAGAPAGAAGDATPGWWRPTTRRWPARAAAPPPASSDVTASE